MTATRSELRDVALAAAVFVLSAGAVARLQPRLAETLHAIKDSDDVYPFPPPPVLRLATLGYVAATTDVLWAKVLVEHGTHWSEHRPFDDLEHYLDAIVELEPTYHPFYEYADTLLGYRPTGGHEKDAREARAYLERGIKELPQDADIWLHYGQFVAFMGPSFLSSQDEQKQWKRDGARAMQHAVELGADVHFGVAASAMLDSRFGERDAAIRFYERAYALTDDEQERAGIAARLELMNQSKGLECARGTVQAVEARWQKEYPVVDRGTYMLLAPTIPTLRCVGVPAAHDPACTHDWDRALDVGACK